MSSGNGSRTRHRVWLLGAASRTSNHSFNCTPMQLPRQAPGRCYQGVLSRRYQRARVRLACIHVSEDTIRASDSWPVGPAQRRRTPREVTRWRTTSPAGRAQPSPDGRRSTEQGHAAHRSVPSRCHPPSKETRIHQDPSAAVARRCPGGRPPDIHRQCRTCAKILPERCHPNARDRSDPDAQATGEQCSSYCKRTSRPHGIGSCRSGPGDVSGPSRKNHR